MPDSLVTDGTHLNVAEHLLRPPDEVMPEVVRAERLRRAEHRVVEM